MHLKEKAVNNWPVMQYDLTEVASSSWHHLNYLPMTTEKSQGALLETTEMRSLKPSIQINTMVGW